MQLAEKPDNVNQGEATGDEYPVIPPEESEPSGSEYNGEDDEPLEVVVDLEDGEPDTAIKRKVGDKKQKKGLAAKDQISAEVAALITQADVEKQPLHPNVEAVKRKSGSGLEATPR
jgi:hypothetical protein